MDVNNIENLKMKTIIAYAIIISIILLLILTSIIFLLLLIPTTRKYTVEALRIFKMRTGVLLKLYVVFDLSASKKLGTGFVTPAVINSVVFISILFVYLCYLPFEFIDMIKERKKIDFSCLIVPNDLLFKSEELMKKELKCESIHQLPLIKFCKYKLLHIIPFIDRKFGYLGRGEAWLEWLDMKVDKVFMDAILGNEKSILFLEKELKILNQKLSTKGLTSFQIKILRKLEELMVRRINKLKNDNKSFKDDIGKPTYTKDGCRKQ